MHRFRYHVKFKKEVDWWLDGMDISSELADYWPLLHLVLKRSRMYNMSKCMEQGQSWLKQYQLVILMVKTKLSSKYR